MFSFYNSSISGSQSYKTLQENTAQCERNERNVVILDSEDTVIIIIFCLQN